MQEEKLTKYKNEGQANNNEEYKGTFIIDDLMIMYKVTSFIQA